MKSMIKYIYKRPIFFLFISWLVVQSALFFTVGVEFSFEGDKYINDAYRLLNEHSLNTNRLFYSIYSVIISISIKLGLGLYGVVVFQLILNGMATFILYKFSLSVYNNYLSSVITTLIFILSFQIQQWNLFLFTESIFISCSIFLYYFVNRLILGNNRDYIALSIVLFMIAFIRPTGIFYSISTSVLLVSMIIKKGFSIKMLQPISIIAFIIIANIVFNYFNLNNYYSLSSENKWVIGGYDSLFVDSSPNYTLSKIKLFFLRFIYYFSSWRPYFSFTHNLLTLITLIPIYILSFIGIKNHKNSVITQFLLVSILLFASFAMIIFINWQGRFLAVILPAFIILAGYGIDYIIEKRKTYDIVK